MTHVARHPARFPVWILAAPALLLASCEQVPENDLVANLPPQVKVTGGPVEGSRTHFRAHIFWAGWDNDGVVVRYEYALDPPPAFTPEELASPETSPGLVLTVLEGKEEDADTLRVGKEVDGVLRTFDYVRTRRTDHVFELSSSEPDSGRIGATRVPEETFSGVHRIYVRALDDLGAYSGIDQLGFTSWTATPRSWVIRPNTRTTDAIISGGALRIVWGGYDPDPPTGAVGPVGFLYKLIPLKSVPGNYNVFLPMNVHDLVFEAATAIPWTFQSAETTGKTFFLNPPEQYVFVIRAVDALGAVEPFVDLRRGHEEGNVIKIQSNEKAGVPILTLSEPTLGTFNYVGDPRPIEREVPVGLALKFRWNASAEIYGGTIESYSWGLDVPDLDREGPGSGWNPWSHETQTRTPLVFTRPGLHVLYIRARDDFGVVSIAALVLRVFDFPLNQEVLFVDDYLDPGKPSDAVADAFWQDLFENSGRYDPGDLHPDRYWFDAGGEGDHNYLQAAPPHLSTMAKFELIVWRVHGAGWNARTALLRSCAVSNDLGTYLAAGGKLWLVGPMSLASTRNGCRGVAGAICADLGYPLQFAPGDFAWDYLKVFSSSVMNDRKQNWYNSLVGVKPWDGEKELPGMEADPDKFSPFVWARDAITHAEAVFASGVLDTIPEYRGVIDSLYTYVAAGQARNPGREKYASDYDGKVCATRWHDPDPDRSQGRVAWFGFPLYHMLTGEAQETFNAMIDWFQEEEPPS